VPACPARAVAILWATICTARLPDARRGAVLAADQMRTRCPIKAGSCSWRSTRCTWMAGTCERDTKPTQAHLGRRNYRL